MANPPAKWRPESMTRSQILFLGGVIGAIIGAGAAHLIWEAREKQARETGEESALVSSGGLLRIGWTVAGLLRQIGEIARGK